MNSGFSTRKNDINIQKIDGLYLPTFEMVIANCSVKDKLGNIRFS